MRIEIQIAAIIILFFTIIIFKMGQSIGRAKARREIQDAIEKSGMVCADGCTFYSVKKIGWNEHKVIVNHSPTEPLS